MKYKKPVLRRRGKLVDFANDSTREPHPPVYKVQPWRKPGQTYYIRTEEHGGHFVERSARILNKLLSVGLNVEKLILGKGKVKSVASRELGTPLWILRLDVYGFPEQKRMKIIKEAFALLGKVHALNVRHGHPHSQNIVYGQGKVGLIDFKSAREVKVNWASPDSIFKTFREDYEMVLSTYHDFCQTSPTSAMVFFRMLVGKYPAGKLVKDAVLRKIRYDMAVH